MLLALKTGALSFLLFATVFMPLERMFPAREGQPWLRPRWSTDLFFFVGQQLVFGLIALEVLQLFATSVDLFSLTSIRAAFASQPLVVQAMELVLISDVGLYWFHRACHRYALLWRFHAVHHSSEHLDWLAAYREHPVDGLLTQLVINAPAVILGFPMEALAWLMAFRGMWAIYIHSNAKLPIGKLRVLLGAPELHHWHHRRSRESQNFANLAPWTDVLFGTYHCPEGEETYELGLVDPLPGSYLGLLASPLRAPAAASVAPAPAPSAAAGSASPPP